MGVDKAVCLFHIFPVFLMAVAKSADVVVGMVAYLMPFVYNHLVEMRIFVYIVTHHKERSLDAETAESFENERR